MSGGGGDVPSNTTSNATTTPWAGQQPSLLNQFNTANQLFYGPGKPGVPTTTTTTTTPNYGDSGIGYIPPSETVTTTNPPGSNVGAFGSGTYQPTYFPGSGAASAAGINNTTVTPFNQDEINGLNNIKATNTGTTAYLGDAAGSSMNLMNPSFLYSNPGNSGYGAVAQESGQNPAMGMFSGLSGAALNPALVNGEGQGVGALDAYANGSMLGSQNPAWQQLSQSVAASVVPQIQSQFVNGGAMDSPQAMYATANGLGSALAPYASQWANTQTQNQLSAASQLGGLFNQGVSNAVGATQGLSGAYGQALNEQLQAAQGISNNYNTAAQIQNFADMNAPALAGAMTTNSQVPFQVGQAEQTQQQNELGGQIANWNYTSNLPINMLNAYAGAISGNYGGSSTLTQPYYSNPIGNALGVASSSLGIANSMFGKSGLFSS